MTTATARTRSSEAGDQVVVALDEALLADGPADARWLLRRALLGGARTIVVDLRCVQSLPGPALAALLCAHRTCRARGGGVVLRHPDRTTRDTLQRTGLWRVLLVQDARAELGAERSPGPGRSARGDRDRP